MDDDELDGLLRSSAVRPSSAALITAQQMAGETARGRKDRRRLVFGVAAGVVVFSGAGTVATHHLHVAPFQTTPAGVQRASVPVHITTHQVGGLQQSCELFLEFTNVSVEQRRRIDAVIAAGPWEASSAQLKRDGRLVLPGTEPARYTTDWVEFVEATVAASVPEVKPSRQNHPTGTPHFTGAAQSCSESQEPTGAPS